MTRTCLNGNFDLGFDLIAFFLHIFFLAESAQDAKIESFGRAN